MKKKRNDNNGIGHTCPMPEVAPVTMYVFPAKSSWSSYFVPDWVELKKTNIKLNFAIQGFTSMNKKKLSLLSV